ESCLAAVFEVLAGVDDVEAGDPGEDRAAEDDRGEEVGGGRGDGGAADCDPRGEGGGGEGWAEPKGGERCEAFGEAVAGEECEHGDGEIERQAVWEEQECAGDEAGGAEDGEECDLWDAQDVRGKVAAGGARVGGV